jgi:hypothetical protein
MTDRAPAPESAKILKAALRAAFPATAFSVRMHRGTGYGSVDVSWVDGPSETAVRELSDAFAGEGFDGMTDSTYQKDNVLPDGRGTGLRYVMVSRTVSPELARRCVAQVAAYWGGCGPVPEIVTTSGRGYDVANHRGNENIRPDVKLCWYTAIHQASCDATRFQRQPG